MSCNPVAKGATRTSGHDPLHWPAGKECAKRWASTHLHDYLTLSTDAETEATLAPVPKESRLKKEPPRQEPT